MLSDYIETSVVSYLKQRPAAHVVAAARQHLTRRWWDEERSRYQLVTSQYVIDEASLGDAALAGDRLGFLEDLPLDAEIQLITDEIMARAILPKKGQIGAAHRDRGLSSSRLPVDVELHSHRQRPDFSENSRRVERSRTVHSAHLHSRGNGGR